MGWVKNTFYEMVNVATGRYMNLSGEHASGVVNNGNTVDLYSRTGSYDQHWCVEYFPYNGATYLRIMCRQGGAWYTLNRHSGNNSCIVWHVNQIVAADSALELFTVDDANKKYRIALAMTNPMLYLTAVGNQLYWRPYAGNDTQLFQFLDPGAGPVDPPGDKLSLPVAGYNYISQSYNNPPGHLGIDYTTPEGTAVYASAAGTVIFKRTYNIHNANATSWDTMGNCVFIQHPNFGMTLYMHLKSPCAWEVGSQVGVGSLIGEVGQTGNATGPHLHFGFKLGSSFRYNDVNAYHDGTWADPAAYM